MTDEFTAYLDSGGLSTDWYRYRWANTAGTAFSAYDSSGVQVGTNAVKTSLKLNMPDADIMDPLWDDWINMCLIDLYAQGVWKLDYVDIVPTQTTPGTVDEVYGLASKIRDVIKIEQRTTATGNPVMMTLNSNEWEKQNRQLKILQPSTNYIYRVWGKTRYNAVGEMTDDFFKLLYDMVRERYFDYRINGRGNYRAYIVLDRNADISPKELSDFRKEVQQKIALSVNALSQGEPAISVPDGGYA